MFRKIHSNRNPKDTFACPNSVRILTLYRENIIVDDAKNEKPPVLIFRIMLISMVISAGISFTISRNRNRPKKVKI
jgi:hypothetical protein